ncbi:RNA 2',3'-cyclic phosphodiesterase [Streptomyces sp. NPDC060194]|uniref:RNA 2',3'-cyclic phosphodiesterase n=1 Tax=Streptomyces sp. NPDC060194 TaxID=3347069 RepID=UPI00365AEB24
MGEPTREPTVRVFVAVAPPDEAKTELERALGPAYVAYPGLRWNRIEDWHITLAFLGELPLPALESMRPVLADAAAARPSLELALRGGGHFDERVVWAGVDGELDGLHRLADDVRGAIRACGIDFETRPLRPHLTLARARRGDTSAVVDVAGRLAGFDGLAWRTRRLHLVASNFGRGPGVIRYRDVDAWEFGGAPAV